MKLVINIEKKHLGVFSIFLLFLTGIFVMASSHEDTNPNNNPGHSANDLGSGTLSGFLNVVGPPSADLNTVLYVENTGNVDSNSIRAIGDVIITSEDSDPVKLIVGEMKMVWNPTTASLQFCAPSGFGGDQCVGYIGENGFINGGCTCP